MSESGLAALLVNPSAGGGQAAVAGEVAHQRLRAAGHEVLTVSGADVSESREGVRDALARGIDRLVVVGGDGSVHLAVGLLAGSGVPLGIVPAGTGNDVARSLGLPLGDPAAAADVAAGAGLRAVDLARAGEEVFAGVLAAGFDSRVNARAERMGHPRGRLRYPAAAIAELHRFRPSAYDLVLDGTPWRTGAMLVAVANAPSYGGGLRIAPAASVHDGLLDVVVVRPVSRATLLRLLPLVYFGRHVRHPAVVVRRARTVALAAPGVTAWADGERIGALPLQVSVLPQALEVLVGPLG